MTQNELPPGETGILRALHNGTDECQWQAVLALALTEDLANARAFVEAVLRSAAQDKTGGRRAADLLDRLPDTVRVSTEQRLHSTTRRRSPLLGRADLVFRSGGRDDWAVVVELKLTAGYGTDQLARYLDYGAPVLSVVGDRDDTAAREVSGHSGWLGEALWRDLQSALRGLNWPRGGHMMWLALLDGMQAVWDDPPSYALELELERDLVARLKDPLKERARALVAEHVTVARAELVEPRSGRIRGSTASAWSSPAVRSLTRLKVLRYGRCSSVASCARSRSPGLILRLGRADPVHWDSFIGRGLRWSVWTSLARRSRSLPARSRLPTSSWQRSTPSIRSSSASFLRCGGTAIYRGVVVRAAVHDRVPSAARGLAVVAKSGPPSA